LARGWASAGVNRVSLGVQSFVPAEASATGRRHTPQDVEQDLHILRRAGIRDANIDLIAGLPGQTEPAWQESLDWVERLNVGHVSVYMLEVDEESRLGRELMGGGDRYGAGAVPDDEIVVQLYEAAVSRLEQIGILRYEISNFARPGHESRHNLKYWRMEPYAGFGADAHSFDGFERRANVVTPSEYVGCWRRGTPPHCETVKANIEHERLLVGLRLREGVEVPATDWRGLRESLAPFVESGLVKHENGRLWLTARGMLLSNEVFQGILDK
jgi:oxygen-independent coproporphyrinogen-3 oxidase